jgi:actin-related protein
LRSQDTTRRPVVIDSGGSCTRAGLAAAAAAVVGAGATAVAAARGLEQLCVFPTLVGRRKTTGMALVGGVGKGASACVAPITPGGGKARAFVGHDARRKRGMLTVTAPLEKGLIVDWDAMEKVWRHAFFQELRIDPREHPVLLTERPLQPKESRERVCQVRYRLL